jgi:hypothetical protein
MSRTRSRSELRGTRVKSRLQIVQNEPGCTYPIVSGTLKAPCIGSVSWVDFGRWDGDQTTVDQADGLRSGHMTPPSAAAMPPSSNTPKAANDVFDAAAALMPNCPAATCSVVSMPAPAATFGWSCQSIAIWQVSDAAIMVAPPESRPHAFVQHPFVKRRTPSC